MPRWCPKKPINDDVNELLAICKEKNHFTNEGPLQNILRETIRDCLEIDDSKYIMPTSSGTSALAAIIGAYSIRLNKPCIFATQAYTFPSSAQGSMRNNIVVDNDPVHKGPNVEELDRIKDDIDGVIVTNCFGTVTDLEVYEEWCKVNEKILVYDNAATSYTFVDGTNVNNRGNAAAISFHETKPFGRGEGGCVIIDKDMVNDMTRIVNFGFSKSSSRDDWSPYASNWRMGDIQAAFIISHLRFMMTQVDHLMELLQYVRTHMDTTFVLPEKTVLSCIPVRTNKEISVFINEGIEAKKYYHPLIPASVATQMYDSVVCLPFHYEITIKDTDKYISILNK